MYLGVFIFNTILERQVRVLFFLMHFQPFAVVFHPSFQVGDLSLNGPSSSLDYPSWIRKHHYTIVDRGVFFIESLSGGCNLSLYAPPFVFGAVQHDNSRVL